MAASTTKVHSMSNPQAYLWLRRFRIDITSHSNRVYANGHQEIEVTVTVEPREGQSLDDQQMASISLVQVDDQGQLRHLDDALFATDERDLRFEYHNTAGFLPSILPTASSQTRRRRFYVSSSRPGGSLDTVYASIWMADGERFVSNEGFFRSSVTIESVSPLRLAKEHFELQRDDVAAEPLMGGHFDLDLYALGFKDPNYRIVESRCYATPSATEYYEGYVDSRPALQFGGPYRADSFFHYAFAVGPAFTWLAYGKQVAINQTPGKMNFVRVQNVDYDKPGYPETRRISRWGLLDQQGNEHIIEMLPAANGNLIDFRIDL
jgi:hypothetical protein